MAKTNSFDISTGVDLQEVDNAVNQARKEIAQRYDFKGTHCTLEFDRDAGTVKLEADDTYRLDALRKVLRERLAARKVPLKNLDEGKVGEGSTEEIYSVVGEASVRDRRARRLLETVSDEYRTLPFAARWLDDSRAELSLRRLKMANVIRGYPVLAEDDGELVSQVEHTMIVTED
ncbi:MAG: DUF520 family protein, partial [Gemmatimonadota bacterium]